MILMPGLNSACSGPPFWITYIVTQCSHYFCNFKEKMSYRSKWTIYKYVLDKSKKCLSVSNFEILCSVVCSASAAYTSLCRGLKYLVNPNVARFLIFDFRYSLFGQDENIDLFLKIK